ncbi:MAG: AMP-binding protein, partial [bacterium]|nr:AMP-binding protein [bacterium]
VGIPGELYIAGASLGIGYVNDRQLTENKFVTVTLDGKPTRLYRTGDLVKWLPDGTVTFISRLDHQVKIRGFRIEPGEIENRLLAHENISEAIVIAIKGEGGDHYLCSYIIPQKAADNGELTPGILGEFLKKKLPGYMVPAGFVIMERFPLNPNGKIDRKSLPEPEISDTVSREYVPPADRIEERLADIWAEVLGRSPESIGVHDNFFNLGGHSLKATRLI